jgi:fumarate hydratase class II
LGLVKSAAARVNADLGVIDEGTAAAIVGAADEVAAGQHLDAFPVDVFQTGSGTSSNMNTNEVIASLALAAGVEVHPNDDVNASQSSNDVFPTAIHVAATLAVVEDLMPSLSRLAASLERKAEEFAPLVKAGRTHLMDATPITLGQEFGGYAATVRYAQERLDSALPRLRELPLGGTAVGTGINTPAGFAKAVIDRLSTTTGQPFTEARNHFEAQGTRDSLVELSGVLRTIAVGLTKICNDLRWLASGPTAGLGEIHLPDLQPGSSIMPGKVNPVLCEATAMVCAQVVGNDATVAWAGAAGTFELNVMMPVMARNLLESIRLLGTSTALLARSCVDGITADADRMRHYAESSPSIVTPLNRLIGYEEAARVVKKAVADGTTVRDAVVALGYVDRGVLTEDQLDAALDVTTMTGPSS